MMNLAAHSIETTAAAQRALPKLILCVGSDYRLPTHNASRFPMGKSPRENQQGTWEAEIRRGSVQRVGMI